MAPDDDDDARDRPADRAPAARGWRALASGVRTWLAVRGRARVGRGAVVRGRIWIHGGGEVVIADGAVVDGRRDPVELHAGPGATLVVGPRARVDGGASVEALASVRIEEGARLGAYCKVLDNHFHGVHGDRVDRPASAPVVIEAGAEVGARAVILPGARVRAGTIVPPGRAVHGPRAGAAPPPPGGQTAPSPARREGSLLERALAEVRRSPAGALRAAVAIVRAALRLRPGERGRRVRVYGTLRIVRRGTLRLGGGVTFVAGMLPTRLDVHRGAALSIGDGCIFNYGVHVEAHQRVSIGRSCLFGSLVRISDLDGERSGPVIIEDGVWVAHGAVVAPGVTIGAGSVISAASVVLKDVPPGSLAAGNPARSMRLSLAAPAGAAAGAGEARASEARGTVATSPRPAGRP